MQKIIEKLLWKCIRKLGVNVSYKSVKSKKDPWVFISYIPEACYRQDPEFLNAHQNRREMKSIVDMFRHLGYNVFVQDCANVNLPSSFSPDIIFGVEPCFEVACRKWPNAVKVYYATGAYFKHQNDMIKKRTDEFNTKYDTKYPYQRLVTESERCDEADYIFQIGSSFTKETYPEYLRSKIRIIRQSNTLGESVELTKDYDNKTDYLWLGSSGTILKGLDLTVEYFKEHPELTLHVVGNVDEEFIHILEANQCSNIHFYGFVNTSSELFRYIARKCNFLIYPSCTEGGCPGAVINSMFYGLIPIVTKWAAFDQIKQFGYLLEDMTIESLGRAVDWSQNLSVENIEKLSHACQRYIQENFTLSVFRKDLTVALNEIINANNNKSL